MPTLLATQPTPFAHVHLMARALRADHVVLLESAQFSKRTSAHGRTFPTRQNSCRIIGAAGPVELVIPVAKGRPPSTGRDRIRYAWMVDDGWRARHLRSIEMAYSKSPFFHEIIYDVRRLLQLPRVTLGAFTSSSWRWALRRLLGPSPLPDYAVVAPDAFSGSAWMLQLAKATGCDRYIAGRTAVENYLDREAFAAAGVELELHSFDPEPWPQRSAGFDPDVSILDLAANVGWDEARERLTRNA